MSALDHGSGTVLGQVQIAAKSNEIPAVRDLLDQFDLSGTLVTADAMHTQDQTAEHIVSAGGAYLSTIKGNRPSLLEWAKSTRWKTVPTNKVTEHGHGRRVTRSVKVLREGSGESITTGHDRSPTTLTEPCTCAQTPTPTEVKDASLSPTRPAEETESTHTGR